METKYGLNGSFKAKKGQVTALSNILLEAAELMKTAKGCHLYVVGLAKEHADTVHISEIWDSKDDHDQSLSLPGVTELIAKAMPLLDGPPQKALEIQVLGGIGID